MAATAIHVVPDDNFDDWVVRNDDRHEIGHYPTREEAELAAQATARELQTKLVVHLRQNDLHELYKELDREIVQNLIRPARLATVTP